MSTNTLGHSEELGREWPEYFSLENSEIEITHVNKNILENIVINDYPYKHQVTFNGEFEYDLPQRGDNEPVTRVGKFEYRSDSGLFTAEQRSGHGPTKNIISEVNKSIFSNARVKKKFGVPRDAVWKFFSNAEVVESMKIGTDHGEISLVDINRVLLSNPDNPTEKLKKKSNNINNHKKLIKFIESVKPIENYENVFDLNIDLYNCEITYADAQFETKECPDGGSYVTIEYNGGSIEMEAGSDQSKEYGKQLIERDLIKQM